MTGKSRGRQTGKHEQWAVWNKGRRGQVSALRLTTLKILAVLYSLHRKLEGRKDVHIAFYYIRKQCFCLYVECDFFAGGGKKKNWMQKHPALM